MTLAAATVMMAGALTACGSGGGSGSGSSTDTYCDDLKDAKSSLSDLGGSGTGAADIEDFFDMVDDFAANAPADVKPDWEKLDEAVNKIEDALDDAGLKLSDLEALSSGEAPEGVDMAKLQQVVQEMQDLSSEDFQKAADNIEEHAKKECDIDLSES
ncbi:MAG: hypothetical protein QM714_18725 [Nocardioides sp.]|uniref:hypothetical protein n=1 Tax=Nocardioides sp. TaxID=35761 RepID=UPI0039E5D2C7